MNKSTTIILAIIFLTGLVIVALPDDNSRLFSLSEAHGPSLADAIGLFILLCPYCYTVFMVWKKRARLRMLYPTAAFRFGLLLFFIGLILVGVSIFGNYGYWWLAGAAIMLVLQGVLFYQVLKRS